ncbi:hypothetical protein [Proteus mirabilis]|nr:hypothetical protein [Proteus mirabilis]
MSDKKSSNTTTKTVFVNDHMPSRLIKTPPPPPPAKTGDNGKK